MEGKTPKQKIQKNIKENQMFRSSEKVFVENKYFGLVSRYQ